MNQITLAAGCFWGVQYYLDQVPGVTSTIVGYTGGQSDNPTYDDVCYKSTGHAEAVQVTFDQDILSLETLLGHFFRLHDPTQLNRQGPDIGDQYRSAIFYFEPDQKTQIEVVVAEQEAAGRGKIVTQIAPATNFFPAEDYHQKFSEKTGRGACHVPYQAI